MNFDEMSLSELKSLRAQVEKAIASYSDREKKKVAAELEEMARQRGFTLAELTGAVGRGKAKRGQSEAKYANPADRSQTWSGRGRRPAWVAEHLAAGRDLADFAI